MDPMIALEVGIELQDTIVLAAQTASEAGIMDRISTYRGP